MEVRPSAFPPTSGRLYDYAAAYIDAGWSVVPLRPLEKRPLVAWELYQQRRASLAEVVGWLQKWSAMNLGVVTGPVSGIAVLDLDGEAGVAALRAAGVAVPPTLTQKTPHGWHAVYRLGPRPVKTGAGLFSHVDTRGEGGYIVVAPSRLSDGVYQWLAPIDLAPVPDWLPDAAARTAGVQRSGQADRDNWVRRALEEGASESTRNDTATRLAGYFRSHRIPEDVVAAIMRPYADRCSPPFEEDELLAVIRSVARYPEGPSGTPPENYMAVPPA
jgi:hypothetical protein